MNAKEQIEAIKAMKTSQEVEAVLTAEKESAKPRKTVIDACEERIGEFATGGADNKEAEPANANAGATDDKKAEPAKEPTKEEVRIADFKRKTQHFIPCKNIIKFAGEYFGKDLKSTSTKDGLVTITLKSGAKFTQRGN